MNASTDTGIRTRKIVSIVLFIVSICLLSLCIGFGVVGLAADAEIGRQAKITDIIYTDLVLILAGWRSPCSAASCCPML